MHDRPYRGLLGRLDPPVGNGHRFHPEPGAVRGGDIQYCVRSGLLPSGQPSDVITCKVMTDELSVRIAPSDVLDLEGQFDVHLAEIACQVLDRDLGYPAHEQLRIIRQSLAYHCLVEHGRRNQIVPVLGLPFVLDLSCSCPAFLRHALLLRFPCQYCQCLYILSFKGVIKPESSGGCRNSY